MKKILTIFSIALTFLFSCPKDINAQNNYNKTDDLGRRQGKWIDYHDNGQIRYTGQFKNNEPIGEFIYYSEDGILIAKNKHSKKDHVVECEMYSPEGKVVAKGKYINKKKHEKWEYFSSEDGSLILVENYDNGLLVGKSTAYLAGTKIVVEETEYVNGIQHGLYSKFYDNGVPMIEATYSHGSLNGKYVNYYSNGSKKEEGIFRNGKKTGLWNIYDMEGYVISTDNYDTLTDENY